MAALYADVEAPSAGLALEAARTLEKLGVRSMGETVDLQASTRGDLAGTPLTLLRHAMSYQQRVMQCHPPGHMITTRRGHVPIEEVVVGDEVLTHLSRWRRVTKLFQRHYEGPLIGLATTGGLKNGRKTGWLWATPNHPILRRYRKKYVEWNVGARRWRFQVKQQRGGQYVVADPPEWVPAENVEAGDLLLLPTIPATSMPDLHMELPPARPNGRRRAVPSSLVVDEGLAEFIGLWLAEGGLMYMKGRPVALTFAFHENERDLHAIVESEALRLFGIAPTRSARPKDHCLVLVLTSGVVARTFEREFGRGAHGKRVPQWLVEAPVEITAAWIRGLFLGDGHFDRDARWHLKTVSRELALCALDGVRRMGFAASVVEEKFATNRRGRNGECRAFRVSVTKVGTFDALMRRQFTPVSVVESRWATTLQPQRQEYSGPVYNLEVEEDESYVCDGIVSHNCWDAFNSDPFFRRLVERTIDFACNGSFWELPAEPEEGSWLDKLKNWKPSRWESLEREEDVWNGWWKSINTGAPNTLPGGDMINRWLCKHLLLSGMFVPHWEWGIYPTGKRQLTMPVRLTCYPASSITLDRENGLFMQERIFLLKQQGAKVVEGFHIEAPQFGGYVGSAGLGNMIQLPVFNSAAKTAPSGTEAFALKYNWSPGDLTTMRVGQFSQTGAGVYPMPPFFSLMPQVAIRSKLFASDLAVLDGLINYIMLFSVGDKDHQPQPAQRDKSGAIKPDGEGDIATTKKMVDAALVRPGMALYLPYYVKLEMITPKIEALLNPARYDPSALEIFRAFGIMFAPRSSGGRERMEVINTTAFEELIGAMRLHIQMFWHMLRNRIVAANGSLNQLPTWTPNPVNTKSDAFVASLYKLAQIGRVSFKTLLRYHNLEDRVELRRIAQDLGQDVDDMLDGYVPTSYVQQTVGPPDLAGEDPTATEPVPTNTDTKAPIPGKVQGPRKTVKVSPGMQKGRPPGSGDSIAAVAISALKGALDLIAGRELSASNGKGEPINLTVNVSGAGKTVKRIERGADGRPERLVEEPVDGDKA
jgi:hypothetical protein